MKSEDYKYVCTLLCIFCKILKLFQVYLGLNISLPEKIWNTLIRQTKPTIFIGELSDAVITPWILINSAIKISAIKSLRRIRNRSNVRQIEKPTLDLLEGDNNT